MALEGSLSTLPFTDLIQILGSARKTGTLTFTRGGDWKRLVLRDGRIGATASNDPEEWIGHTLVGLGKIDEETLERCLARQRVEAIALGKILVDGGWLPAEDLRFYLLDRAYAMVGKLLAWNEASFVFEEFVLPAFAMVPLEISVEELLMEGFRRADEVSRFREIVPSEAVVLEKTGVKPAAGALDQTVVGVLFRKLDEPRSVRQLRSELKTSEFSLLEGITRLMEQGVVRRRERRPPRPPPPGWREDGRKLAMAQLFEQAIDLLRLGLAHDPGCREAQELLARVEESFVHEVTRAELPVDAVPVLACTIEELGERSLSPVEAFLLTRVDGEGSLGSLLEATPLPAAETLLALQRLVRERLLRLRLPRPVLA